MNQYPQQQQYPQQGQPQYPQQGGYQAPAPQGNYAPPQGQQYAPPPAQGQYAPPPQQQQYGAPAAPQQLPYENNCTFVGQVAPNQWIPQGFEWKAPNGSGQGHIQINLKLRRQTSYQGNVKVSIQYVRVIAYGQVGQQLMNMLRPGLVIRVVGAEFKLVSYKDQKTQQFKQIVQFQLPSKSQNGQLPIQVIGDQPYVEEKSTPSNYNNGQQNGGQQQGGYVPPQQGGQQQAPQYPPQGQPQGQYAPPQQGQQYAPPAQPQYAPPQGQPYQQPGAPAAGVPQQPAPGQAHGQFPPPQGNPFPPQPGQAAPPPPQGGGSEIREDDIPF
jgi:hypothetical protein